MHPTLVVGEVCWDNWDIDSQCETLNFSPVGLLTMWSPVITKEEYLKLQKELASARQNNVLRKQQKLASLKKKTVPPKPWYVKLLDFLTF